MREQGAMESRYAELLAQVRLLPDSYLKQLQVFCLQILERASNQSPQIRDPTEVELSFETSASWNPDSNFGRFQPRYRNTMRMTGRRMRVRIF